MSSIEERNLSLEACKMIELSRKQKGMSRVELAKKVNVSYSYLWNIETQRRRCVSYGIIRKISDILNISISELTGEKVISDSESPETFENIFFNKSVCIEGQELSLKQKLEVFEILKTLSNENLSKAKKLEYIIAIIFDPKDEKTSA